MLWFHIRAWRMLVWQYTVLDRSIIKYYSTRKSRIVPMIVIVNNMHVTNIPYSVLLRVRMCISWLCKNNRLGVVQKTSSDDLLLKIFNIAWKKRRVSSEGFSHLTDRYLQSQYLLLSDMRESNYRYFKTRMEGIQEIKTRYKPSRQSGHQLSPFSFIEPINIIVLLFPSCSFSVCIKLQIPSTWSWSCFGSDISYLVCFSTSKFEQPRSQS